MSINLFSTEQGCSAWPLNLTEHATIRMKQRGISSAAVQAVLTYGRRIHAKGAVFCVVGRKEVKRYAAAGLDLTPMSGLQILIGADGAVITAYRNQNIRSITTSRRSRSRS